MRLLPPVPHVGTVLSAADAYVSDSDFEGWSLAASEAAWNGLPLVLSDCGSARQLVGDDGVGGRVVGNPLGDPLEVTWQALRSLPARPQAPNEAEMADAVLQVIEDGERWSAARGAISRRARALLAPTRVARAYVDVLTSVAAS